MVKHGRCWPWHVDAISRLSFVHLNVEKCVGTKYNHFYDEKYVGINMRSIFVYRDKGVVYRDKGVVYRDKALFFNQFGNCSISPYQHRRQHADHRTTPEKHSIGKLEDQNTKSTK
jgi:hypothetical protein